MRPLIVHAFADRSAARDALRAAAALLVLLSHARDMLLCDAAAQPALSWPAMALFALSGLGHEAVLVFFVLSGDLVMGSMLRRRATGHWSLRSFALARLVRLWVVLVPCLLGGALLDRFGGALVEPGNAYGIPALGGGSAPPALGLGVLIGNLAFLQTIAVPVLGSNGALWSLANEAWYYLLAALLFSAWDMRRRPARTLALLAATLGVVLLLPYPILRLAAVWALGAGVALLRPRLPAMTPATRKLALGTAALAVFAAMLVSRLRMGFGPFSSELVVGCAVAALLLALPARGTAAGGCGARWAGCLARRSYALYLSHCPVLALFAAVTLGGQRLAVGLGALALLGCSLILAGVVAQAVWWSFERHTARVQAWVAAPRVLTRAFKAHEVAP